MFFYLAFKKPPVVILTGEGNLDHGLATLVNTPTITTFQCKLLHYNGNWE